MFATRAWVLGIGLATLSGFWGCMDNGKKDAGKKQGGSESPNPSSSYSPSSTPLPSGDCYSQSSIATPSINPYASASPSNDPYGSRSIGDATGYGLVDSQASYQTDIMPILQTYCVQCHRPGGQAIPDLSTYMAARNAAPAALQAMMSQRMPPGGIIAPQDQSRFQKWVTAGMPETPGALPSGLQGGSSLGVYYSPDIQSLFQTYCVSCHTSGGRASPDLSSYASAAPAAQAALNAVMSRRMPPNSPLMPNDQAKIQQWVATGALEMATGTGSSVSNPCGGPSPTPSNPIDPTPSSLPSDPWVELISPPEKAACDAQHRMYDRLTKQCHKAQVATSYQCTRDGILTKFRSLRVDVTAQIQGFESQGFQIDQCGEFNNEPVVHFYKKVEGTTQNTLQVQKLCKQNSAACNPS